MVPRKHHPSVRVKHPRPHPPWTTAVWYAPITRRFVALAPRHAAAALVAAAVITTHSIAMAMQQVEQLQDGQQQQQLPEEEGGQGQ